MPKEPGFYFYTGDYLKEPSLDICSYEARACWTEMLAKLSECPFRGVFVTASGEPWSLEMIAGAIRGDTATNVKAIEELLRLGVASRNQKGAIYSRRMVRDQQIRELAAARKRKERRLTTTKQTKSVTRDVTRNVTPLSEEEREVGKELNPVCVVHEEDHNTLNVALKLEAFDFESYVRKVQQVYVDRDKYANHSESACCEEIEWLIKQPGHEVQHRSEAANFIIERTRVAADLMRKSVPPDKWPSLARFMADHKYLNDLATWERTNGISENHSSKADIRQAKGKAAITGAFARHLEAAGGADEGDAGVLPKRGD